jgi:hypothetical protein
VGHRDQVLDDGVELVEVGIAHATHRRKPR